MDRSRRTADIPLLWLPAPEKPWSGSRSRLVLTRRTRPLPNRRGHQAPTFVDSVQVSVPNATWTRPLHLALAIQKLTMPPQTQTVKTATAGKPNMNRRGSRRPQGQGDTPQTQAVSPPPQVEQRTEDTQQDETEDLDSEEGSCWICAEPVKYYSVSECNHRTCHICALRLRALYKKLECTFCKVSPVPTYNPYGPRSSLVTSGFPGRPTRCNIHEIAGPAVRRL